jgi:hypothetical protein
MQPSRYRESFDSAGRSARHAIVGCVCAFALYGLPAMAAVEEATEHVERSSHEGRDSGVSLDPLGWLLQHGQALGSDPLAGATAGAGVFALLTALHSTLALLRGQRRQRRLLGSPRREEPDRQPSTLREVLEPTGGQPSRFHLEDLDLVIKPIEVERPERAAAPAPSQAKARPADVRPEPARPLPQTPDESVSPARVSASTPPVESPLLPDEDLPVLRSPEPLDPEGRVCQSFALLAEGRFDEAIEVTRVGLDGHPDAGRVFGQLSRVASLLGRKDQAIELATKAYRADRSEERFEQLLRLRSAAHRFEPREGDRLRRAVAYNPEQPVYLRALGIFEALHGNVGTARRLLRAALRHETGEETRGAIARELLQLERSNEGRRFAAGIAAGVGGERTSGLQ